MTTSTEFTVTDAERCVADLLPMRIPVEKCHETLAEVPVWFHTFALNKEAGIYTPGAARDHRYRIPYLPADFHGMSVLDVGTCDGFYAFLAEARGAERVLAIDNQQYRHMARARWGVESAGGDAFRVISGLLSSTVEYRQIDVLGLAGAGDRFDFVYCCGMLHRVENPLGVLRVLRGLLNPHGRILVETYGEPGRDTGSSNIRVLSAGEANAGDDVHYWGFSAAALTRLAGWAGLSETGDTARHLVAGHPRIIATLQVG